MSAVLITEEGLGTCESGKMGQIFIPYFFFPKVLLVKKKVSYKKLLSCTFSTFS